MDGEKRCWAYLFHCFYERRFLYIGNNFICHINTTHQLNIHWKLHPIYLTIHRCWQFHCISFDVFLFHFGIVFLCIAQVYSQHYEECQIWIFYNISKSYCINLNMISRILNRKAVKKTIIRNIRNFFLWFKMINLVRQEGKYQSSLFT